MKDVKLYESMTIHLDSDLDWFIGRACGQDSLIWPKFVCSTWGIVSLNAECFDTKIIFDGVLYVDMKYKSGHLNRIYKIANEFSGRLNRPVCYFNYFWKHDDTLTN